MPERPRTGEHGSGMRRCYLVACGSSLSPPNLCVCARSLSLTPTPPRARRPPPPSLYLGFALPIVPLPGAKSTIHQVLPSDTKHVPSILWLDISVQVFHVSLPLPLMFGIQDLFAVLAALCPSPPLLQPLRVPLFSIYSLCISSRIALSSAWAPSPPYHTTSVCLSVRQTHRLID